VDFQETADFLVHTNALLSILTNLSSNNYFCSTTAENFLLNIQVWDNPSNQC